MDQFQSNLESSDIDGVLSALSTSDGAYTDACYADLASRLILYPEDTLLALTQSSVVSQDSLHILHSLGTELYYVPSSQEKDDLLVYLRAVPQSADRYMVASQILTAWEAELG
jgi:hypothetical protein